MLAICRLKVRFHKIETGDQSGPPATVSTGSNLDVAARKRFYGVLQRLSEPIEGHLPSETVSADIDLRLIAVSEA